MRFVHVLLLAAAVAVPRVAPAKAWQGIQPGTSTRADVLTRFGEPSTQGKLDGRSALVYRGDRAITGTRQAQFVVRDDGVVSEVNVFPAAQLDRDSVEGTYGKGAQKTFTDDFRSVWVYRSIGVTVFFTKDNLVEAIRFQPPLAGAPAGAPPRAGAQDEGARAPEARVGGEPAAR
jgi:hypothetical protein